MLPKAAKAPWKLPPVMSAPSVLSPSPWVPSLATEMRWKDWLQVVDEGVAVPVGVARHQIGRLAGEDDVDTEGTDRGAPTGAVGLEVGIIGDADDAAGAAVGLPVEDEYVVMAVGNAADLPIEAIGVALEHHIAAIAGHRR